MDKASFERSHGDPKGQEFGPYTLVCRLGVGGMAETFEAIRRGPGDFSQRVCLKLVLPFFREHQDFLSLFEREARLAAKLRHSNIVGVIDFGEIDGVTYMALELVDGADLASLLDAQPGRRISAEQAVLVGHDLAAALEHAHDPRRDGSAGSHADNAIVHRDISPSNVLVSQRGEILLTDFGVAKAITGTARQQSAVKGKVPYMSPEQLRSETLDGRADLFALGVVLFESLAGQRPFRGEHDPATIMQILNGDRPSLMQVASETPPELADIVERLLSTDRDARPADASEVLELLDPLVPSPRARRGFGTMAAAVRESRLPPVPDDFPRGSDPTAMDQGRPGEASGVARTTGSLAAAESDPGLPGPGANRRRGLGWLALAAMLAAGAFAVWINDGAEPPATTKTIDEPATVAPAPAPAPPPSEELPPVKTDQASVEGGAQPASGVAATEPATISPGRLSVVVFPWGQVWINGASRGSAPLKNIPLKPGKYRISAGQGKPTSTKIVRLRQGQRRTVEFDLSE